ncbi:enoyl-CoA hydratase [Sphingobium phenoxybenzoativorans]|uniref:enoyl-CoA hydratase n=1 Tax=Sphingobium phenoxybenzoativorans TaxID=1592790 RepID=UPI00087201CE|nr:enoyl-CoA hydratase [Sphingobium phenoxybenzoativorans]
MSLIKLEKQDGIAIMTLNDPERRNILTVPLCEAILEKLAEAEADEGIHALIVTGEGSAFCAGADFGDLQAASEGDDAAVTMVYRSFMAVANSMLPTIAAVNGPAVGAGFNLALACDMRVACPEARFDTRFLKIGLHPGGGHSWLLLRAVGWSQASRLLLAGKAVDGETALSIGLADALSEASGPLETAKALAAPMAKTPRELLLRTKASLRLAGRSTHDETFAHETAEQAWSLSQPAFRSLLKR